MFTPRSEQDCFQYVPVDEPSEMMATLPAGVYNGQIDYDGRVFFFNAPQPPSNLIELNTDTAQHVSREIDYFFDPAITARLANAKLRHCRGIILHGDAGTGKTSIVRSMIPRILEHDAVVLLDPSIRALTDNFIPAIRRHDPERPVVIIYDEFHSIVRQSVTALLGLLDGMTSPDHLLTIGTTNYMARIPTTLTQRPSRFSLVLNVPPLPREIRVQYALNKFGMLSQDVVAQAVELTSDMPLDYLEEALKLSISGLSIDQIQARFLASSLKNVKLLDEEDLFSRQDEEEELPE